MIELKQISKAFGEKTAVHELDLKVHAGEIFAFLGPNGAGKTTTIKMMVGLLRPTSGTARLSGFDIVSQARQAKAITGYVPDQPMLYDKLTGREFLGFIAEMYGVPPGEAGEAIAEQIHTFDLDGFVDELAESYSHGMKQRLVFASAMLHRPNVVILDEPLVGLDPRGIRLVKDLLKRQAATGTTVFMSTHTLAVAEEVAHRIGVIDRGRLAFLGTVDQLSQRYSAQDSNLEDLFLQLTEEPYSAEA